MVKIPLNIAMATITLQKRQAQPTESVVHVTVTAAGTVVYTLTATSYSYIPSYSTITPSNTFLPDSNNGQPDNNSNSASSHTNTSAIIGGVIGGVAGIALIGLAFFLYSRLQKRKRSNNDHTYYQQDPLYHQTASPTPRHLIAPLEQTGKHESSDDTKHYYNNNGYYEDLIAPAYSTNAYYSVDNSVTSDSLPSTAVDTSYGARHVPDEVDYPLQQRHVPNANHVTEPPHTRD